MNLIKKQKTDVEYTITFNSSEIEFLRVMISECKRLWFNEYINNKDNQTVTKILNERMDQAGIYESSFERFENEHC